MACTCQEFTRTLGQTLFCPCQLSSKQYTVPSRGAGDDVRDTEVLQFPVLRCIRTCTALYTVKTVHPALATCTIITNYDPSSDAKRYRFEITILFTYRTVPLTGAQGSAVDTIPREARKAETRATVNCRAMLVACAVSCFLDACVVSFSSFTFCFTRYRPKSITGYSRKISSRYCTVR